MKKNVLQFACLFFIGCWLSSIPSWAKDWKGVVPGTTKKSEVLEKFGPPTRELTRSGEFSKGVLYQGAQHLEGTKQVQFLFDAQEVIQVIYVFPALDLKRDQIIATYGKGFEEKLNDSFKTYLYFKKDGIVVYFKEGNQVVSSITFQKPLE